MPYKDPFKKREDNRIRYKNRRAIQVHKALRLLGGVCIGCGTTSDLEFDHLDPSEKKFAVGQKLGCASWAYIKREVLKCRLLCRDCHAERTALQRQGVEWEPMTWPEAAAAKAEADEEFNAMWDTF